MAKPNTNSIVNKSGGDDSSHGNLKRSRADVAQEIPSGAAAVSNPVIV